MVVRRRQCAPRTTSTVDSGRHAGQAQSGRGVRTMRERRLCTPTVRIVPVPVSDVVHYLDQPPVAPSFARLLKQHRLASGLTQEGLAERAVMRMALGEAQGVLSPLFWVCGTDEGPRSLANHVPYPCVLPRHVLSLTGSSR